MSNRTSYQKWTGVPRRRTASDRYFVQSEQVRREPRIYWVVDISTGRMVEGTGPTKRKAERECAKLNAGEGIPETGGG